METRQIKFKAKRPDNGEWVEGDLLHSYENGAIIVPIEGGGAFSVDPSTVCQFTGIYDKDGLEVWEHDILLVNMYKGEVVYKRGGFAVNNGHMEITIDTCIFQIPNSNRSHVINLGSKFNRKEKKYENTK